MIAWFGVVVGATTATIAPLLATAVHIMCSAAAIDMPMTDALLSMRYKSEYLLASFPGLFVLSFASNSQQGLGFLQCGSCRVFEKNSWSP